MSLVMFFLANKFFSPILLFRFCFLFLLICLSSFFPSTGFTQDNTSYLQILVETASRDKLWEMSKWHHLLLYQQDSWGSGVESYVDSDAFFIDAAGKYSPERELVATLTSFFDSSRMGLGKKHPQCKYPARYAWLKKKLKFNPELLQDQKCEDLTRWLEEIDAESISLIFPVAYLNNPASMFGHTFLRLNKNGRTLKNSLLDYTISFVAEAQQERGPVYAFKGLTGGYQGRFLVEPYFQQVRKYSHLESRDIWEYLLDFTQEEIISLLLHVWELQSGSIDYYFLNENCSFHLLTLLEAVRPEKSRRAGSSYEFWVTPSEVVRILVDAYGVNDKYYFRPSHYSVLEKRMSGLNLEMLQVAENLAETNRSLQEIKNKSWAEKEKAQVLELALDYLLYLQIRKNEEDVHDDFRINQLFQARSQNPVTSQQPVIVTPQERPDLRHPASRVSFGKSFLGTSDFIQAELRPVLHDLLDPSSGYVEGAELAFLDTVLRYYPEQNDLELESLSFFKVLSVPPVNYLIQPVSWGFTLGLKQLSSFDGKKDLAGNIEAGAGYSYYLNEAVKGYCLLSTSAMIGPGFQQGFSLGTGIETGVIGELSRKWRSRFVAKVLTMSNCVDEMFYEVSLNQHLVLDVKNSIRLRLEYEKINGIESEYGILSWMYYF